MLELAAGLLLQGYISNIDLVKEGIRDEFGCQQYYFEENLFHAKIEYWPRIWKRMQRERCFSREETRRFEDLCASYGIMVK